MPRSTAQLAEFAQDLGVRGRHRRLVELLLVLTAALVEQAFGRRGVARGAEEPCEAEHEAWIVRQRRNQRAQARQLGREFVVVEVRAVAVGVHPDTVLDIGERVIDCLGVRGDDCELSSPTVRKCERTLVAELVFEIRPCVLRDRADLDFGRKAAEVGCVGVEGFCAQPHDEMHRSVAELRRVEALGVADAVVGVDVETALNEL